MSTAPISVKQPPAADRVYSHVKQAVLERRYEGGMLLTEGELAEAVGVSRTPVREALLRLEVEGLLRLYPKKGALVLPVSAQEIADVVETRLLVEEHAARRSVPLRADVITRLEALLEEQRTHAAAGDLAAVAVSDRCFHAEIVKGTGNDILVRLYDQLRDRQLRMGVAVMHANPDRIAKNITEHAGILQALREGNSEAAVVAVHQHVSRVRSLIQGGDARGGDAWATEVGAGEVTVGEATATEADAAEVTAAEVTVDETTVDETSPTPTSATTEAGAAGDGDARGIAAVGSAEATEVTEAAEAAEAAERGGVR